MKLEHRRVHIVGAGGAGMSALAKVLVELGHEVSGSDLRAGATLDGLADLGVEVGAGHRPELALGADLVVASSAVPDYDEELAAAAEAGIPVWRRPRLLAELTKDVKTLGVTGTHGKTTTTAMLIMALRATGADPSFVVGGTVVGLGTNGHVGSSELLVLEADEAFRTFESIHLDGLIITNVEADHVEHFGSEEDLLRGFVEVAGSVAGPVLACSDDAGSSAVATESGAMTYGQAAEAAWRVSEVSQGPSGAGFRLSGPAGATRVQITQPGMHAVLDAAGALALGAEAGHDLERMAEGIRGFRGVGRRWERKGTVRGVTLYDDYAHHPTEIAATLESARAMVTGRVWAVFQPHLYSRTARLADEFGRALSSADRVVVTDVYGARETPVPGVTGELVADSARAAGADVTYVPHRAELADALVGRLRAGDLVVTMGAGDITLLPAELATRLGE